MHEVEVQGAPEWNREEQEDEGNRVGPPLEVVRQQVVRVAPEEEHLVGGPDRHAARERPEHVVPDLVVAEKAGIVPLHLLPVVLEVRALHLEDVEVQVKTARHEDHEHQVPRQQERYPSRFEIRALLERRLQEVPGEGGESAEGEDEREQELLRKQEPDGFRNAGRPLEHRIGFQRKRGMPGPDAVGG